MNRIKRIFAVLIAAISTGAVALPRVSGEENSESTQFNVVQKSNLYKFDVIYVSEQEGPVKISIIDDSGEIVSTDEFAGRNSFVRTYDFRNLEVGAYKIVLENAEGTSEQIVNYNPFQRQMNLVVNQQEENKYKVLVAGFDKSIGVTLSIYTAEGELVKTDLIQSEKDFTRTYDLSNLDSDSFVFQAESGSRVASANGGR